MICDKCGMQNSDNSKFCVGCGSPIESMVNVQPGNSLPPNEDLNNSVVTNPVMNNPEPVINNVSLEQPVVNDNINLSEPIKTNEKKNFKLNKKWLFIIGGVVLAIIAIVLVCIFVFGNKNSVNKDLASIIDLNQPIPVRKDGNYVYIDTNGKLIKDIKYLEASEFEGEYAAVELQDGTAAIIDKKQNIKVTATSFYAMEYIYEYDLWLIDGVLYNGKFKPITDKTLQLAHEEKDYFIYSNSDYTEYGIINSKGKKIYTNECLISDFDLSNYNTDDKDYAIIQTNCYANEIDVENEYIISLETGKVLYTNEYKAQYPDSYYYDIDQNYDGVYYIYNNNYDKIRHIYIKNNEVLYSTTEILDDVELYGNDYLILDYGYNYDELGKEQRKYYYDLKNKKILKEEPELPEVKEEPEEKKVNIKQRQIVECDYGYGLIDDKNVIMPCMYDKIDQLPTIVHEYLKLRESKDLVYVKDNNKLYIYDANKRKEFFSFEDAEDYEIKDSETSVFITQEIKVDYDVAKTIVYSLITGEKIVFDSNSDIKIGMNYFTESKNGKKIYYNTKFEKIYTEG